MVPSASHRAFVQAGHLDAEFAHEGHVVLDHDHGLVAIDLLEQLGGLLVSASVMPATGSSTRSNFGSCASSMPISSHCFCPCDRLPATRERKASAARCRAPDRCAFLRLADDCHSSVARTLRSFLSARFRLSSTVCMSNTVGFWNLRPMPSSAIWVHRAWTDRGCPPRNKRRRYRGRVLPVTTSIMVVLPAPLGPMIARISPGSMMNDNSLSALKPSNETEMPSRYSSAEVVCLSIMRPYSAACGVAAGSAASLASAWPLRQWL